MSARWTTAVLDPQITGGLAVARSLALDEATTAIRDGSMNPADADRPSPSPSGEGGAQ